VLATPSWLGPLALLSGAVDAVQHTPGLVPLRFGSPDLAVNLHGSGPQSHRLLQALRPRRLVAYASPEAGVPGPTWRDVEHQTTRWCRLIRVELGVTCDEEELDLVAPSTRPPTSGAVVIHPGAAFPSRRCPPERFSAVARSLTQAGESVVVTGSASERALADHVAGSAGILPSAVHAGRSLLDLAALVASARLVVCGDTGMAHLATAYRTPSVVLFGPVSPAGWGPPPGRPQHRIIWHGDGTGDPWGSDVDRALAAITVDEVVEAATTMLATDDAKPATRDQWHETSARDDG
jgi:hypothetical protein